MIPVRIHRPLHRCPDGVASSCLPFSGLPCFFSGSGIQSPAKIAAALTEGTVLFDLGMLHEPRTIDDTPAFLLLHLVLNSGLEYVENIIIATSRNRSLPFIPPTTCLGKFGFLFLWGFTQERLVKAWPEAIVEHM